MDNCLVTLVPNCSVYLTEASLRFTTTALFISRKHPFHYIIPRAKQASSILTNSLKHKCYPAQGHPGTIAQRSGHH